MKTVFLYLILVKLLSVAVGGLYFRLLTRPYKLVCLVSVFAIATEWSGRYIATVLHRHNLWLFNLYSIVELWLLGVAALLLMKRANTRKFSIFCLAAASTMWVFLVWKNSIFAYANTSIVFGGLALTGMYIAVLFEKTVFSGRQILKQPEFWLAMSNILFFACLAPFWSLYNYLIVHAPLLGNKLMAINWSLNFLRYPMVAVSFILAGQRRLQAVKVA